MRLSRLSGVVLAAAAAAAAPAWCQIEVSQTAAELNSKEEMSRKTASKPGGAAKGKLSDEAAAAVLKKKFEYCKKTGDCKSYLFEKEKRKKNKLIIEAEPADVSPGKPSPAPAPAAGRSREGAPSEGTMPAEPPEARGSLTGQAM
ncbi:MAG: hypothetical protein NUW21_08110, partial [Elusimicrobia bacterium]|nr:hypothetical protein [Elusimicrobiota bacterium]